MSNYNFIDEKFGDQISEDLKLPSWFFMSILALLFSWLLFLSASNLRAASHLSRTKIIRLQWTMVILVLCVLVVTYTCFVEFDVWHQARLLLLSALESLEIHGNVHGNLQFPVFFHIFPTL